MSSRELLGAWAGVRFSRTITLAGRILALSCCYTLFPQCSQSLTSSFHLWRPKKSPTKGRKHELSFKFPTGKKKKTRILPNDFKITMRYHRTSVRTTIIKKSTNNKC